MTIDQILDDVLAREGGYVDHPADRGDCTNRGITLATLAAWRGRPVTCDDVARLTGDETRAIYRHVYITRPGLDRLPEGRLRALAIDFGVHSGPQVAIRAVQRILGVTVDGVIGPRTIAAANAAPDAWRLLLQARGAYLAGLLQRDPSQRVFAAGWLMRLMEFVA